MNASFTAIQESLQPDWSGAEKQSSNESWIAWHKELTRSSEEVLGLRGRIQKLQDIKSPVLREIRLSVKSGEVAHQQ